MVGPHGRTTWWNHSGIGRWRPPATRLSHIVVTCLLLIAPAGCVGVSARDAPLRNAIADGWERLETNRGLNLSLETGAVLARQHLLIEAQRDPIRAVRLLEARLQTQTEPDGAIALAELSYYIGVNSQTTAPVAAMPWYRDAAVLATLALGDPATSRPDLAAELHNRALARLIRVAQTRRVRDDRKANWREVLEGAGSLGTELHKVSRPRADRRPARRRRPQRRRNGSRLSLERSGSAADRSPVYRRVRARGLAGSVLPRAGCRIAATAVARRTWRRASRGANGGPKPAADRTARSVPTTGG